MEFAITAEGLMTPTRECLFPGRSLFVFGIEGGQYKGRVIRSGKAGDKYESLFEK